MSPKMLLSAAVSAASLFAISPVNAQSLTGSQITGAAYCCTSTNESDRVTNQQTATVGPQIEFPSGSFVSNSSQLDTILADIDVRASALQISYTAAATALPGGFNGYVFTFVGAPTITGVSADPSSTYSPVLSFNENTIFVNESGLELSPSSFVLINVSAVPEPTAFGMLIAGLGLVGMGRLRGLLRWNA